MKHDANKIKFAFFSFFGVTSERRDGRKAYFFCFICCAILHLHFSFVYGFFCEFWIESETTLIKFWKSKVKNVVSKISQIVRSRN